MDFKRALVRPLKGIFCKSIRRLLETKRACIGFELYENSLQVLVDLTLMEEPKESSVSSVILRWKSNRFRVKLL